MIRNEIPPTSITYSIERNCWPIPFSLYIVSSWISNSIQMHYYIDFEIVYPAVVIYSLLYSYFFFKVIAGKNKNLE